MVKNVDQRVSLFREQFKLLQPLIKPLTSTQKQTVKASQNSGTQELARELQRKNYQVDTLARQSFYFVPVLNLTSSQLKSARTDVSLLFKNFCVESNGITHESKLLKFFSIFFCPSWSLESAKVALKYDLLPEERNITSLFI